MILERLNLEENKQGELQVSLGKFCRMASATDDAYDKELDREKIFLSFEYVVGSLFPTIYNEIKAEMAQQYIKGFADAMKQSEGEGETE